MNIFTYGSLTFPEVVEALTTTRPSFEDVTLPGFERRSLIGKTYPGLIENELATVDGRLYFDLDPISATLLDRFEDKLYERRLIQIARVRQESVTALVYLVPSPELNRISAEPWNRDHFQAEHLVAYVEMCRRFREKVIEELLQVQLDAGR